MTNVTAAAPMLAHPRSRGEHDGEDLWHLLESGSSPLARGTCSDRLAGLEVVRLIPARAGNMPFVIASHGSVPAHPRSRGEHAVPSVQRIM